MKLTYKILIIIFTIHFYSYAQQIPHYTQYMHNMSIINPAYVGVRSDISLNLQARQQWLGVEGAPKTQNFGINARTINNIALGLSVQNDAIGLLKQTNFDLNLSYTITTSRYSRLAFGIKGGISNFNNQLSIGLTPENENYNDLSGIYPNAGLGVFFYTKKYYFGLSLPQLFDTPQFDINTNYNNVINKYQNYFGTFGYVFQINEKTKFKPSFLLKYATNLPTSVDINANILLNNKIEFGASYRYNDAISAMTAIYVKEKFRIGYSYDYTLTNLSAFNNGSHEIMLLYDIDFKKRKRWLNDSSCYF